MEGVHHFSELAIAFLNMLLHIDHFLGNFIQQYGAWGYVALFCIVFAETGLVVTPFLPGDSLLFVAGAFCATGMMSFPILVCSLIVAAILGNTVNYQIGKRVGPKIFTAKRRWLDQEALLKTHDFYLRHGGKTIVIARFLPVIRTFAPFVAGICAMPYSRFQLFNISSGLFWVIVLVCAGYFFGNLPFVKQYLNVIVLAGISAAILPIVLHALWRVCKHYMQRARIK